MPYSTTFGLVCLKYRILEKEALVQGKCIKTKGLPLEPVLSVFQGLINWDTYLYLFIPVLMNTKNFKIDLDKAVLLLKAHGNFDIFNEQLMCFCYSAYGKGDSIKDS